MRGWMILALSMPLLLVATLPLRMALQWAGADSFLSASAVEGTIWNGRLLDVQAQGLRLGDVSLALDIASLFGGRLVLRYGADGARAQNGMTGHGILQRGANGVWRMQSADRNGRAL